MQAMGEEMMSFSAMANLAGSLPPNARYLTHRNECYDWGTLGWLLSQGKVCSRMLLWSICGCYTSHTSCSSRLVCWRQVIAHRAAVTSLSICELHRLAIGSELALHISFDERPRLWTPYPLFLVIVSLILANNSHLIGEVFNISGQHAVYCLEVTCLMTSCDAW